MRFPLLRKELREHRWQLLIVFLLQALGVLALAIDPTNASGSYFEVVRRFSFGLATLGSWRVAQRVIAREYTAKTQLYLETLPVTRARVLATKWLLGAAYALGTLALVIAISAKLASHHEVVERTRLLLIAVRAGGFVLLVYAAFAAVALLGRYRVALALFALFAVFFVSESTNISLAHVGPGLLVSDDLAYGRQGLPHAALWQTLGFTAGLVVLAFALVLVREGNLQAMLAERMSHREKVFIGCVFVGLFVGTYVFDEVKQPAPFALASGESVTRDGIDVHVAVTDEADRSIAHALAEHEAQLLGEVRSYIGLEALPSVSLLPSGDLDPDVFQRAKLHKRDGLVVRARFGAEDFELAAFDAWLVREVLTWSSREETLPEERQWVAEGFAWWWVARNGDASLRHQLELRERYGLGTASWPLLHDWLTTRERLGPCVSGAVAAGAVQTLSELAGAERFHAFIRAALGWRSPKSVRALWLRRSTEELLHEQAQLAPDALVRAWNQRLQSAPTDLAAELAGLSHPRAELSLGALGASAREARYRLVGATPSPVTVLYSVVPPVDGPIDPAQFTHELNLAPDLQWHALPRTFATGQRLAWTVSERIPALGCNAWTGLRREVLW